MKVVAHNSIYEIYGDSLKTYEGLPPQVYNVRFSKQSGFYLEAMAPLEIKEQKIYGVHESKCQKVLDSFATFKRNLGVILSGDKGIGKSLFAKLLGIRAIENGYPLVIVDKYIPGIASYLESIDQECVVMFDEFDKTYGEVKAEDGQASPQAELLTLFDGMAMGKKLYVITCNDLNKLNDYLVNRPGRSHYHFRFEYPTPAEITEYMQDKLPEEYWGEIQHVVTFSRKIRLNYDCLRAIVFELSTGAAFKDAIADLNIVNTNWERYRLILQYENGMTVSQRGCCFDMFSDDEVDEWLCDKNGNEYVKVFFEPAFAEWAPSIQGNVIPADKLKVEYWNAEDEEVKKLVAAAKETKPLYLLIKRELDKSLHYAV